MVEVTLSYRQRSAAFRLQNLGKRQRHRVTRERSQFSRFCSLKAALLCVIAALAQTCALAQEKASVTSAAMQHWTPQDLWRGVDVESLPLEVQILRSWEEDGCSCAKLTYVSEIADGTKIRIFAIEGAPEGARELPGILHIHGGGQTASLAWVK